MDRLHAEEAELLRQNREDVAEVLRSQLLCPALWREALHGCPVAFHDFSISGQKSGDQLAAMYPGIAGAHAQIAHLMIGANDCRRTLDAPNVLYTSLPEYEKNVRFIVSSLQMNGSRGSISSIPSVDTAAITRSFPAHRIIYRKVSTARRTTLYSTQCCAGLLPKQARYSTTWR